MLMQKYCFDLFLSATSIIGLSMQHKTQVAIIFPSFGALETSVESYFCGYALTKYNISATHPCLSLYKNPTKSPIKTLNCTHFVTTLQNDPVV